MHSVYDFTRDEYIDFFEKIGESSYRAKQMFNALYKNDCREIDDITTIKKDLRTKLSGELYFNSLEIVDVLESKDTIKFLFKLEDGNLVETVLMRQVYGNSLCVTSQIGCNMGCKFCASGKLKKLRDLRTSEIVLQVIEVQRYVKERVSNIVVMGIGEPFDNYDNVIKFINIINDDLGIGIGARHITVSTSGVVPKIYDFTDLGSQVNLAISLHAANDETRSKIMPINNKYNLAELKKALFYYCDNTSRRLTIEYVLIDGVNDSIEDAKQLVKYLRGLHYYINLIPLNATSGPLKRSSDENIENFFKFISNMNINIRIRQEFGQEINAACGQLRAKHGGE